MSKEKNTHPRYMLVWHVSFTVLEKHIFKVLQKKGACSDEEIAEILCMDIGDVGYIIGSGGVMGVEGDPTRRTIKSNFKGREYAIKKWIAARKQYEDEDQDRRMAFLEGDGGTLSEYNCRERKPSEVPKELREEKADQYYVLED